MDKANELRILLKDYLDSLNLVLVDIIYRYEGRDIFLRVLVDKPEGGINLDECARVNRGIGELLDDSKIIPGGYILEVSSPGLDRPLKTKDDFLRLMHKQVKFFLNEAIGGKLEWDGVIDSVSDKSLSVVTEGGLIELPFLKVNKAKLII